jgi:uncharacterized membrane protein YfcA
MPTQNYVLVALLAFAVGAMSSLFGIGGGPLLVPLLMYSLELGGNVARGTSMALVIPIGVAGLLRRKFLLKQSLAEFFDLRAFAITTPMTILGSLFIGTILYLTLGYNLELSPSSEILLRRLFAVLLLLIGARMLIWP